MKRPGRLGFALAALAGIALFAALGAWQWQRGTQKQHLLLETAEMLAAREAVPLADAVARETRALQWTSGSVQFDARGPLLLDNQLRAGRAGVRAYRLALVDGSATPLLVDLGWLPLPADRALPTIERPAGRIEARGLLAPPPSAGIALGTGIAPAADGWLLTRIDMHAIAAATGLAVPPAPRVLRLDPDLPLGYERDLDVLQNTLPPERHRGYAVQWWGLAVTVFVVWLVLGFRRTRR
ncbi:SURF1 family protein [Chiayiivirga flava]|uniref:SURF1-like protein n=1 Tax=Chiayiivirga flava TaxID=659595 RepID=A0A7W8D7P4_9GAMM|nr:SURF1 family protein [Chiayiivirga flava]MBB5209112.1 cytochrome oxidase assembly protein ShyY1 [Chiayiivirga flava]